MSTITRPAEPVRADFERSEPRCRICRDPDVRRLVNDLRDWDGVSVMVEGGNKTNPITYTDIFGLLEPLNEGRDKRDRITYDSLWVHAKRHYDLEGLAAYWSARVDMSLSTIGGTCQSCPGERGHTVQGRSFPRNEARFHEMKRVIDCGGVRLCDVNALPLRRPGICYLASPRQRS